MSRSRSLATHPPRHGFSLVELVVVIVVLGLLATLAIPRFFDLSVDAKIAACKGSLGAMREGISHFHAHSSLSGPPSWPTLAEMRGEGVVMNEMPENPFSTAGSSGCAAVNLRKQILAGTTPGVPVTAGTAGAWCYKASTGEIWANTASGNGEAGF